VPVLFNGSVLVAYASSLFLLDRNGGVIWAVDGAFYGQPVVNGGTIYAGTSTDLRAISESSWKVQWQPAVILATVIVTMLGYVVLSGGSPKDKMKIE
jgi:outer membrane protein assembly factor BamB